MNPMFGCVCVIADYVLNTLIIKGHRCNLIRGEIGHIMNYYQLVMNIHLCNFCKR